MPKLLLFFFLLLISAPLKAAEIRDVRIGQHPDKARLVLELSRQADFMARVADQPQRLEIFLPLNQSYHATPIMDRPFVSFSAEAHDEALTRLSLPLEKPYIIRSAFMLAAGESGNTRLVIDMVPVPKAEFSRHIGVGHGPLQVAETQGNALDSLIAGIARGPQPVPVSKPKAPVQPVIVIDPGHGGRDPGAVSPKGIREKDITLSMAKTMARILNQSGRYDARLTRTDDRFIKLYNRVRIARNAGADLFISVHADSVGGDSSVRGASVYTLSDTASDAQTARLAARENRADLIGGIDLGIEDDDVSTILIDLSMRETMNRSKILANTIISGLRTGGINTLKGPHRYAGFAVLKAPDVPSVLIETGFISNEAEARILLTRPYQEKIAKALLKSLDQFYGAL